LGEKKRTRLLGREGRGENASVVFSEQRLKGCTCRLLTYFECHEKKKITKRKDRLVRKAGQKQKKPGIIPAEDKRTG